MPILLSFLAWATTCSQCGALREDPAFVGPEWCYSRDGPTWQQDADHDGDVDMIDVAFFQAAYPMHPFDLQRSLWVSGVGWPVLNPDGSLR